ncbi:MAG: hypothetical protein JXX14_00325, partial [Deltaproteobacteria bacterium]|nr:hypothetical protein [Deltaproteobacteria bacterium]
QILRQTTKSGGPIDAMRVIVRQFEDLYFGDKPAESTRYEVCQQQITAALLPLEKEDTHVGS